MTNPETAIRAETKIFMPAETAMPPADQIFGRRPSPVPWPSTRPLLMTALELLPTIDDDRTADLIEQLALAIVDRDEELKAARAVLSAAFTLTSTQYIEIVRLKIRGVERRRERSAP